MTPIHTTASAQQQLADRSVVADIETGSIPETDPHGQRWYDTRAMLDPRELSDYCVDHNRLALDYALERGLVAAHPQRTHLVRITDAGQAL